MRHTVILCDLHEVPKPTTGSESSTGSVPATSSVRVIVDGVPRRLDVCAEHAARLGALPEFADDTDDVDTAPARHIASSRLGAPAPVTHTRAGSRRSLRAERAAARDWARLQGAEVADRGRLPTGLLERYREQAG